MSKQTNTDLLLSTIKLLCDETFDQVHGAYLDRGTSLFETINALDAGQASTPAVEGGTTIAGHVEHVRFYLEVIERDMEGTPQENVNWRDSWRVQVVTDTEWNALRTSLRSQLELITGRIESYDDWNSEGRLGGTMAILLHTAYHLGAIRQLLINVKS
jgi:hypothetical protein